MIPPNPLRDPRSSSGTSVDDEDPMSVAMLVDELLLLTGKICGRIASPDGGGGVGRRLLVDCDPAAVLRAKKLLTRLDADAGRYDDDDDDDADEEEEEEEEESVREGALAFFCDLAGHPRLFGEFGIDRAIVCRRLGRAWGKITGLAPPASVGAGRYGRKENFDYGGKAGEGKDAGFESWVGAETS